MAEVISGLSVIILHDPVNQSTEVINAGTVGSTDLADTRTRNVGETQRVVTSSELNMTLRAFLASLTATAGVAAGLR